MLSAGFTVVVPGFAAPRHEPAPQGGTLTITGPGDKDGQDQPIRAIVAELPEGAAVTHEAAPVSVSVNATAVRWSP